MSGAFPQLRHDPITGRAVLIAPERGARPGALVPHPEELPDHAADCPFCEGREERTPPELFAIRREGTFPNQPGWQTRVVSNQYPAVRDAIGAHELIVECPKHETSLAALPISQVAAVLRTIRQRLQVRREERTWKYAQWFKNHGTAAGASLAHAHSQMICLPDVPTNVQAEVDAVRVGKLRDQGCVYCRWLQSERKHNQRIIFDNGDFVVVSAFAARFPYETWILPTSHRRHFEESDDRLLDGLAISLHRLLNQVDAVVGRPGYNLFLHTGPWTEDDFHWHFELLPRITGIAGFELGAGMFINPIVPEDAARQLRG